MKKRKSKTMIKLRTFEVQWINHPEYGNSSLFVTEDLLYAEYVTDIKSFDIADSLRFSKAMIHFVGENMCIITRHEDIEIPFGAF